MVFAIIHPGEAPLRANVMWNSLARADSGISEPLQGC
jgi:hypothetical protein